MKPWELYDLISRFQTMIADKRFSDEARFKMAIEWVNQLPPQTLIPGASNSRRAVMEIMDATIRKIQPKQRPIQSTSKTQTKVEAGKQKQPSDSKNENGGGRKMAKTPGNAKKPIKKKSPS